METPLGSKWWPNELWGADDEAGSTNWYTKPEVVLRAIAQIEEGKVYKLGHDYHADMPFFGPRRFILRIPGTPTGGPFGASKTLYHDEYLATEIGQVGTQFDGLGHIGVQIGAGDRTQMRWYNGHVEADFATAYGLTKLGVEKLHPIVARGVLIDFAGLRGENWNAGECASMDDVAAALEKQGMADFEFMAGDAVLFRFGGKPAGRIRPRSTTASPGSAWTPRAGWPRRSRPGSPAPTAERPPIRSPIRTSRVAPSASTSTCRPGTASSIRRTCA